MDPGRRPSGSSWSSRSSCAGRNQSPSGGMINLDSLQRSSRPDAGTAALIDGRELIFHSLAAHSVRNVVAKSAIEQHGPEERLRSRVLLAAGNLCFTEVEI